MARSDYPSGKLDQYVVRFPDGMRDWFKQKAKENERSLNAEIIFALKEKMAKETGAVSANSSPVSTSNNAALAGGASITQDERTV